MLHDASPRRSGCSGFLAGSISRRAMVRTGMLGALGLSMADLLRLQARADGGSKPAAAPARRVIQINLPGGLAQQESWDPKPEAAAEYRGPFGVVKTKLPGVAFSENLARLAAIADKLTVVRSVVGKIPDHGQASYHLFTGYTPSTVIDYPADGGGRRARSWARRTTCRPYVAVPGVKSGTGGSGYMSTRYGAFELGSDPGEANYKVRDFSLPGGVDPARFDRRKIGPGGGRGPASRPRGRPRQARHHGRVLRPGLQADHLARGQRAFALDDEPASMDDLYGVLPRPQDPPEDADRPPPDARQAAGRGRRPVRDRHLRRVRLARPDQGRLQGVHPRARPRPRRPDHRP